VIQSLRGENKIMRARGTGSAQINSFFFHFYYAMFIVRGIHCDNSELPYIGKITPTSTPSPPYLKQLQEASSFISYVYMKPINHIPLPSSLPFTFPPPTSTPHTTYFIVLPFIINSKVNGQRSFLKYPHWDCTLLKT
jgi:hypothetical protein